MAYFSHESEGIVNYGSAVFRCNLGLQVLPFVIWAPAVTRSNFQSKLVSEIAIDGVIFLLLLLLLLLALFSKFYFLKDQHIWLIIRYNNNKHYVVLMCSIW